MVLLLVEVGGLRVVIAPRCKDIVPLPHAGTAVDLREKEDAFINNSLYFLFEFGSAKKSDQLLHNIIVNG